MVQQSAGIQTEAEEDPTPAPASFAATPEAMHHPSTLPPPPSTLPPPLSARPPPPPQRALDAVAAAVAASSDVPAFQTRTWAGVASPPPASVAGVTPAEIAAMRLRLHEIAAHRQRALASLALEETELVAAEALEEERLLAKLRLAGAA